ncbi:MAG: class I SAM-dependent methyltransferase [Actinomycetota bacterium]
MIKLGPYRLLRDHEIRRLYEYWYHDYSSLGLATAQRPGNWAANQLSKEEPITLRIANAINICDREGVDPTVLELFCADGFFGCVAADRGASSVVGIDIDEPEVQRANLAAQLLGQRSTRFVVEDVWETRRRAAIGICAGGLYHLEEPERLLTRLRGLISRFLVIQTVFHLDVEDPDYFESPAPGWDWGSRTSYAGVLAMAERAGWRVLDADRNELLGNDEPSNRGSAYLLCEPDD